jgi:predicted DNA-binding antitoxin AbrB/MazE fold protein
MLSCVILNVTSWWTMTQITDAIYSHGVLKPTGELDLREDQRVRVIVESLDEQCEDRAAALARLKAGITNMQFFSGGRLPSRDELHDRS